MPAQAACPRGRGRHGGNYRRSRKFRSHGHGQHQPARGPGCGGSRCFRMAARRAGSRGPASSHSTRGELSCRPSLTWSPQACWVVTRSRSARPKQARWQQARAVTLDIALWEPRTHRGDARPAPDSGWLKTERPSHHFRPGG
jgi:hypothetical protein